MSLLAKDNIAAATSVIIEQEWHKFVDKIFHMFLYIKPLRWMQIATYLIHERKLVPSISDHSLGEKMSIKDYFLGHFFPLHYPDAR
jgi:hypothetical protein